MHFWMLFGVQERSWGPILRFLFLFIGVHVRNPKNIWTHNPYNIQSNSAKIDYAGNLDGDYLRSLFVISINHRRSLLQYEPNSINHRRFWFLWWKFTKPVSASSAKMFKCSKIARPNIWHYEKYGHIWMTHIHTWMK